MLQHHFLIIFTQSLFPYSLCDEINVAACEVYILLKYIRNIKLSSKNLHFKHFNRCYRCPAGYCLYTKDFQFLEVQFPIPQNGDSV